MIRIDKSVFEAEELKTFEALLAKATVDTEAAEEEMQDEKPAFPPKKKPTEKTEEEEVPVEAQKSVSPEMAQAMERLENLEKSIEMKEFSEVAKKYAPLGEKEEELAQTLYDMKKSNEANYNAYIAILDKSLGLVEKSGLFAEIGKRAPDAPAGGSAVDKIESAANEIMKSDASLTREQAVAKAWTDHPELIREYEEEYNA